jgi:transposase-like protein
MSDLDAPWFHDDEEARKHLEAIRWPNGPVCPHCGGLDRIKKLGGKSHRPGLYKCYDCEGHFTVTVGTVMESSRVPLHKWFLAIYWLCSSKKGISSHQLHRMLGVTYKTAWFMTHRIREAMREGTLAPMGGAGSTVEVDETFIGRKEGRSKKRGYAHKHAVLSLVDRNGNARSFHVSGTSTKDVLPVLQNNIRRETKIMTDEAGQYAHLNKHFAEHHFVSHGKEEYVRGTVHTNTIEGFFSIFKRGMTGIYQHCGEPHLHRYLSEFDFRYNHRELTDWERTTTALRGIEGKRLTYRPSNWEAA